MAYTKYINRKGKTHGPYYYTSVRDAKGKVKTIYLGSDKEKALAKEVELHKNTGVRTIKKSSLSPSYYKSFPRFQGLSGSTLRTRVIYLGFIFLFLLVISAQHYHVTGLSALGAESISGSNCDYLTGWAYPNWVINSSMVCDVTNEDLVLEGNLTVNGTLRFDNVTLHVNASANGSHLIQVNFGGVLTINRSSNIMNNATPSANYNFTINGSFTVEDSSISSVNSDFTIYSNYANISNTSISNGNGAGLLLSGANDANISNVTFSGVSTTGVYLYNGASNNRVEYSTIPITSSGDYGIRLGTGTLNNNTLHNNTISTIKNSRSGILLEGGSANTTISNNTISTTGLTDYGIYAQSGSTDTTMTGNTITTTNTNGYGIRSDDTTARNVINSNNISTAGNGARGVYGYAANISSNWINVSSLASNVHGVELLSAGSTVSSNTIFAGHAGVYSKGANSIISFNNITTGSNSAWGGITLSSVNQTVIGNVIAATSNNGYGMYIEHTISNANTIQGNTITTSGSSGYGLYFEGANDGTTVSDTVVTTSGTTAYALYIEDDNSNNVVTNVTLNSTNSHSILVYGVSLNNTIVDSTLVSGFSSSDVFMESGTTGTVILQNVSFNQSKLSFDPGAGSASGIFVDWFLFAKAESLNTSAGVSGVAVNITNASGTLVFNGTTDSTGFVGPLNVREYLRTVGLNTTFNTTYTVNFTLLSASFLESNLFEVLNINQSLIVNISFTELDIAAPVVVYNSSTDENVTVNRNWVFVNVSISDDLSSVPTVILEWDGVNETISSNSSTNWWINKTGLSNANYTYRVYATDPSDNVGVSYSAWGVTNTSSLSSSDPLPSTSSGGGGGGVSPTGQLPFYLHIDAPEIMVEASAVIATQTFTFSVENAGGLLIDGIYATISGLPSGIAASVSPTSVSIDSNSVAVFSVLLTIQPEVLAGSYYILINVYGVSGLIESRETLLVVRVIEVKPAEQPLGPGDEVPPANLLDALPPSVHILVISSIVTLLSVFSMFLFIRDLEIIAPVAIDVELFKRIEDMAFDLGFVKL